jgi:hypothetical protein
MWIRGVGMTAVDSNGTQSAVPGKIRKGSSEQTHQSILVMPAFAGMTRKELVQSFPGVTLTL